MFHSPFSLPPPCSTRKRRRPASSQTSSNTSGQTSGQTSGPAQPLEMELFPTKKRRAFRPPDHELPVLETPEEGHRREAMQSRYNEAFENEVMRIWDEEERYLATRHRDGRRVVVTTVRFPRPPSAEELNDEAWQLKKRAAPDRCVEVLDLVFDESFLRDILRRWRAVGC